MTSMPMKRILIGLLILILGGCSQKAQDAAQKAIDAGTGKSQVETYQQLQKQIRSVTEEHRKQFEK